MLCYIPGASCQDITEYLQIILKGECEHPEVVVHIGANDMGRKGKRCCRVNTGSLAKGLKAGP